MLNAYCNEPFGTGTEVALNDYFTGDGTTTAFNLTNKTGIEQGNVIQAGVYDYFKFNGGFSVVSNTVNLSSAPAVGASIIAPGIIRFTFKAYGQATVYGGYPNPNVSQTPIYFADILDIQTQEYVPSIGQSGILILITDKDATTGADPSWFKFASMLPDGTPGTYGSAGAPFSTTGLQAADTLQSGVSALATMITVANGSQFTSGRYVYLDAGSGFQDQVRVTNISGNILTVTPTTYAHSSGATVFENAFGAYVELTLPTSFTNTHNYYDCVIEAVFDQVDRM